MAETGKITVNKPTITVKRVCGKDIFNFWHRFKCILSLKYVLKY